MQRWWVLIGVLATSACQGGDADSLGGAANATQYGGVDPTTCTPSAVAAPLQRLNAAQYVNSAADLLGLTTVPSLNLPTDDAVGPFSINTVTVVTDLAASQYQAAAETLAPLAVASLSSSKAAGCASLAADANCLTAFVTTFGARAFRRPLTSDEVTRYTALASAYMAAGDSNDAVRIVVQGMLQSPWFLYRPEFGNANVAASGTVPLSSYELATRLSYFLWNSTPDAALQEAAANNLQSPNALTEQVDRMLASTRFGQSMGTFVQSLLDTESLSTVTKDPNLFPSFNPNLAAAMTRETFDFTTYVMQQDGRLSTLMTAPYSVLTDPLFAYYGVAKPTAWQPGAAVELNAAQRTGLLTQGAFLTVQAHYNATGVVARGMTLRENFLCQAMPPPPPDVPPLPTVAAGQETARQMFANHVSSPTCAACHDLMDPMGLSFEHYDGIGSWRATDNGLTIDASGTLTDTSKSNGTFADGIALAALLGNSPDVQACMATQMLRFSLQRDQSTADACTVARYTQAFIAGDGDLRALARSIVNSSAFLNLSGP